MTLIVTSFSLYRIILKTKMDVWGMIHVIDCEGPTFADQHIQNTDIVQVGYVIVLNTSCFFQTLSMQSYEWKKNVKFFSMDNRCNKTFYEKYAVPVNWMCPKNIIQWFECFIRYTLNITTWTFMRIKYSKQILKTTIN